MKTTPGVSFLQKYYNHAEMFNSWRSTKHYIVYVIYASIVVVVVYFILSRLLYLANSANLGVLCMPHPGMGPLV